MYDSNVDVENVLWLLLLLRYCSYYCIWLFSIEINRSMYVDTYVNECVINHGTKSRMYVCMYVCICDGMVGMSV